MVNKCIIAGCQKNAYPQFWEGKSYCFTHYNELMAKEFEEEWNRWENNTLPSSRLRYLFGRYVDENKWEIRDGLLTAARIRDRAFNFQKEDEEFTFEITRHPDAFKNGYVTKLIVQKWKVSLQNRVVEFIEERNWTENDPDL